MKIFISYSSKDKEFVRLLAQDLKNLDHVVWFDQELTGGQAWWDIIIKNIQECDLCVFALTQNSLDSFPCKLEYTYASASNIRVLPIQLADVNLSLLPYLLSLIQVVDYRTRNHEASMSLIKALNNLPPARPLPAILPKVPLAPVSPLAMIKTRLEEPSLAYDEQKNLYFELQTFFRKPDTRDAAKFLLQQMRKREDIYAKVAEEIDSLLRTAIINRNDHTETNVKTGTSFISELMKLSRSTPVSFPSTDHPKYDTENDLEIIINKVIEEVVNSFSEWKIGLIYITNGNNLYKDNLYSSLLRFTINMKISKSLMSDKTITNLMLTGWINHSDGNLTKSVNYDQKSTYGPRLGMLTNFTDVKFARKDDIVREIIIIHKTLKSSLNGANIVKLR